MHNLVPRSSLFFEKLYFLDNFLEEKTGLWERGCQMHRARTFPVKAVTAKCTFVSNLKFFTFKPKVLKKSSAFLKTRNSVEVFGVWSLCDRRAIVSTSMRWVVNFIRNIRFAGNGIPKPRSAPTTIYRKPKLAPQPVKIFKLHESCIWNAASAKLSEHKELWGTSVTFSEPLAVWSGIRKRYKVSGNNTAVDEVHPGKKMKENIFHSAQMERSRFEYSLAFRVLGIHTFSSNITKGGPFEFWDGGDGDFDKNILQANLYQKP